MSDNPSGVEIINLENIYLFDGGSKENWDYFSKDITNESYTQKIVSVISNYLTTQPKNEITLDIIDYILDFGCPQIINLISTKDFMDQVLNLLKPETEAGLENQKKCIFLIKKWAKKFEKNQNLSIFTEQYNMLDKKINNENNEIKNKEINNDEEGFPPGQEEENNGIINNINENQPNQNSENLGNNMNNQNNQNENNINGNNNLGENKPPENNQSNENELNKKIDMQKSNNPFFNFKNENTNEQNNQNKENNNMPNVQNNMKII